MSAATTVVSRNQGRSTDIYSRRTSHGWVYVLLAAGLVLLAGPFVWMLLGSFKTDAELRRVPPSWLPESATLENYRQLFGQLDFPTFFFNSTLVATAITISDGIAVVGSLSQFGPSMPT